MSRGTDIRERDEDCAVYAIGEAINYLAVELMHTRNYAYTVAQTCAAESMALTLRDLVKSGKYWEG